MQEVIVIGQMDNKKDGTFESANRVYDSNAIAPTLPTCGGGGIQPKILEVEVIGGMGELKSNNGTQYYQQNRVYNKEKISPALNSSGEELVPKIVDCIAVNELGYIEHGTGKHQSNTVYGTNGASPTITTIGSGGTQQIKIIDCVAMRGREQGQQLEIGEEGLCNSLTTAQKDNMVLIRQATKNGAIPCKIGGGGGLELPRLTDKARKSPRERRSLPDSNNGEYP